MKKMKLLFGVAIVAVMFSACGGGSKTVKNDYLGELPSMEKNYAEKIEKKEQAIKENTDMEKAFTLAKELDLLKDERKEKIEEYITTNPLEKPLPFEPIERSQYTINEVTVNKAAAGNLNIVFDIKVNEDLKSSYGNIERFLFVYYKAVDSKGNDIPDSKTVATNFERKELKAGVDYKAYGSWQSKAVKHMEDFAKVVEITKEEYEKK